MSTTEQISIHDISDQDGLLDVAALMVDDVSDVDGITVEAASIVGRAHGGPILEVLMRDNHGRERTYQLQGIGWADDLNDHATEADQSLESS